ncbi:DUF1713 domain protein [Quillaja saponaria]|uniref:Small ribosomal subunit protein mS38 n=1 Tax=Quillaja saponaria TaxID=32244 RepID=A0AAD7PHS9_QUISA|nr:DUF1713 domain protein [Quillaja saponaria]KAJ7956129.1 DUF1713 domain protein [Quillaja saponaria]
MASLMHKLSKNSASLRTISIFNNPLLPKSTTSLISNQISHIGTVKPDLTNNPFPFWGLNCVDKPTLSQSLQFFPNFPIGYCLNPTVSNEVEQLGVEKDKELYPEDARSIWADSVKKKRKKKMNKHKYKKLKKRLRRKTKI